MSLQEFARFLDRHLEQVEPLSKKVNLAYWKATISGRPSDFERSAELQVELQQIYANPADFEKIRQWNDDKSITDAGARRQIELLHNAYLRNQVDPALNERITKLQSKIENAFNVHRAKINGKEVTTNEILRILKESNDTALRRNAWKASKQVGAVVEADLITLVRLRNEAARSLGYGNYYSMSLDLSEQDEGDTLRLFTELDSLTREPFEDLKQEIDRHVSLRFRIDQGDIRPWHYNDLFFQEAPQIYEIDVDGYYANVDILELVRRFYAGIDLPVDDILSRSDLYEKRGKDQHAYCTDIDRRGDIRILTNIKNDETWAGTLLHELGHAVHDLYIDPDLPFLLRQEAHIFTTEAIAMLFGRLSKNPSWIKGMTGISDEERDRIADDLAKSLRLNQLVFARWCQVMLHFERELYVDPDQNLNRLWWDTVQRYQLLAPPDNVEFPHWASKTHIVSAPVYYHNYLLGELLASQLSHYIARNVATDDPAGSMIGQSSVGDYLKGKFFAPGALYRWDALIERATGEKLSVKYFVQEFVEPAVS